MNTSSIATDIETCRKIQKIHGTSYYLATLFFPRDLRDATFVLYALFRVADEIVDTDAHGATLEDRRVALEAFIDRWQRAHRGEPTDEPVLRAAAHVFHRYNIPLEYADAFFAAMLQDTTVARYGTYTELEGYMYGSASVVGRMLSYCIGFTNQTTISYADKLGTAMQLTNFLRDIREDYEQRDRIYIPTDEMQRYGVTEEDIAQHRVHDGFVQMIRFQIDRARTLYAQAEDGIPMLSRRGRLAVRLASRLYAGILDEIERAHYDIFAERVRVSKLRKAGIVIRTIIGL